MSIIKYYSTSVFDKVQTVALQPIRVELDEANPPHITVYFTFEAAQRLLDDMWNHGMRPSHVGKPLGTSMSGHDKPTKTHVIHTKKPRLTRKEE